VAVPAFPSVKLFEMPLAGYLGFQPFALEVYAMYHAVRPLARLPEPDGGIVDDPSIEATRGGDTTVAKKGKQRSVTKKAASKPSKGARRPAGQTASKVTTKTKAPASSRRAVAASRPAAATADTSLAEHAERLRDQILRSKLTHPDPWSYAAKARAWGDRAETLVVQITAAGDTPAVRRTLEALVAELEGDRDFREARRLF
jgi:hypothetical protein